ncbi:Uncharacterized protein SCF082_LOCUS16217 [Durusdinium trenchii]|uniref:Uncharacterized protein n=1 Tax=Durusdinium trenchii TaxID=1381693 RepID=A0ABP0KBF6_9DINO
MAVKPEVEEEVRNLLQNADTKALVGSVRKIMQVLEHHGLACRQCLSCMKVGVHDANRDGLGVSAFDCHRLCSEISDIGYDSQEFKGVAIQLQGAELERVQAFNRKLQEEAQGLLGGASDMIRYASLAGSHANYAMRCFASHVEHKDDELTLDGRLSLERLASKDGAFYKAIVDGETWMVLEATCSTTWPTLAETVQAAYNAAGQLARHETDLQVMKKLHTAIVRGAAYDKAKMQVLRSKPPNAGAVPRMYTFVMHFAGGRSGEFLRETEAFLRIKCVPVRHLACEVYESLAIEMRHTGAQQFPKCRHALLKALFTTESRITASDLRRLFSQKSGMMPQLEECEGLITDVQKLFKDLDAPAEVKLQHQGDFEISLMFRLLQKKEPGKEQHDSLQSVAHSAVMLMREHSGLKTPDLVSPWMREYDESGKQHTTAALEEAGFAVSQRVLHKKTKQEGEIVAMTSEKVTINLDSKTTMTVGAQDFLMGQWQTVKAKAPIEFLAWEDREPFKSVEVSVMELQAGACLALCEAAKKKSLEGLIALQTKPAKDVIAAKAISKHALQIIPVTSKIQVQEATKGKQIPPSAISMGQKKIGEAVFDMWLMPHPLKEGCLVSPAFMVRSTEDESKANMEIWHVKDKVPVLRNTKAVKKGEQLLVYRPKVEAVEDPAAHPSKKARKAK